MIPARIVRFIEERANHAFAGTRDRDLVPCGSRVSAWRFHTGQRTMTVCFPDPLAERLLADLEDNGQFALTVAEYPTHETYQLKGHYLRRSAVTDDDLAATDRARDRLLKTVRHELPPGVPESVAMSIAFPTPKVAVEIEIEEIYLQTPGPQAGSRIHPSPDA